MMIANAPAQLQAIYLPSGSPACRKSAATSASSVTSVTPARKRAAYALEPPGGALITRKRPHHDADGAAPTCP
jgi:hypothetical protein